MAMKPHSIRLVAEDGTVLAEELVVSRDSDRPFASGRVGYNASGKWSVRATDGEVERHQMSFNLVQIITKPK